MLGSLSVPLCSINKCKSTRLHAQVDFVLKINSSFSSQQIKMARQRLTARKSTGGLAPRNYRTIADLQRRWKLEEIAAQKARQQMTEGENINSTDNNHLSNNQSSQVEMTNEVSSLDKMPPVHFMCTASDEGTIAAAELNGPAYFQKLTIKMVPNGSLRTENKSPEQTSNCASTSGKHQSTKDSESDNFTLEVSSPSDKTTPEDEPLNRIQKENNSYQKNNTRKRNGASLSIQSERAEKKRKNVEENACKEFVDKLNDKSILLKELSQQIDLKELLEAYKEKKSKGEIEKEAITVLGLKAKEDTVNPEIIATLVQFLEVFSTLFVNDDFQDIVLNAMKGRLTANKVLEVLDEDDLKRALIEKFTPTGLFNLLPQMHQSTVSEQETPPVTSTSQIAVISALTDAIKSREYLSTSEELFNVMLRDGPKILSNESKNNITNVLKIKLSGPEFNDISHEVTGYHFEKK